MASASDARAGGAFIELYAKDTSKAVLDSIQNNLKKFSVTIALIGAGMASFGASITAPLLYGLQVANEWSGDVTRAARATGIEFEAVGSLSYALKTDMDGLAGAMFQVDKILAETANGSEEAAQKLAALGLSFDQLRGMSQADRLRAFAGALGDIGDHAARVQAIGSRAARAFTGLDVSGGRRGIEGREQRGRDVGAVLSEKDNEVLRAYGAAMRELGIVTRAVWTSIGVAIAPVMTDFVRLVTSAVQVVKTWVDNNRPLIATIFRIADAAVTVGGIIVGIGGAFYAASVAVAFFTPMLSTLAGIMTFIPVGTMLSAVATGVYAATVWTLNAAWTAAVAVGTFLGGIVYGLTGSMLAYDAVNLVAIGTVMAFEAGVSLASIALAVLASGFGIVTAVQFLYAIGMGTIAAATWLWGAATATATAIAVAFKIALAATGAFFAWYFGFATLGATGTHGFSAALVIAWIWENIVTAGIYLLVTALGLLVVAFAAVGLGIPIVALGAFVYLFIAAAYESLRATSTIGSAWDGLTGTIGGSFSRLWGIASEAFSGIANTAMQSFGAIKDALSAGDFELAFEIIKASGQLLWLDIKAFGLDAWIELKFAFLDVWAQVTNGIVDAWNGVVLAFKIGWIQATAQMKAYYESLKVAIAGGSQAEIDRAYQSEIRLGEAQVARERLLASPDRPDPITGLTPDQVRGREAMERDDQRIEQQRLAREGRPEERAGAQRQLDVLQAEATYAAAEAEMWREVMGAGHGAGEMDEHAKKNTVMGTFSADAVRGFAQGNQDPNTPILEDARRLLERVAAAAELVQAGLAAIGMG